MPEPLRLVIHGQPATKKNSQNLAQNPKPRAWFPATSKAYR